MSAPLRAGRALMPWAAQPGGEAACVDWLSGDPAGKEQSGCCGVVGDHELGWRPGSQPGEDGCEAGREQDRVPADGQVGAGVPPDHMVGGEVADPLGVEAE